VAVTEGIDVPEGIDVWGEIGVKVASAVGREPAVGVSGGDDVASGVGGINACKVAATIVATTLGVGETVPPGRLQETTSRIRGIEKREERRRVFTGS
jgi:hypothetical protein